MDFLEMIFLELGIDLWWILKWVYMAAFLVYLLFAIIAWRQIELMVRSLNGSLAWPLRSLGWMLIVLASVALVVALVVL